MQGNRVSQGSSVQEMTMRKEKHAGTIDYILSEDNQLPVARRVAIPHQGRENHRC